MKINLKLSLILLLFFLISQLAFSQSDQGINFQSIARDATGSPLVNQSITLSFTVLKGASYQRVYQETHAVTTDAFGLFNVVIGEGTPLNALTFSSIDWADDEHHLQIRMDDGHGWVNLGTTQFVTVPYSQHANTSNKAVNMELNDITDVDTTGITTDNVLKWDGTKWGMGTDFGGYWQKPFSNQPIIKFDEGQNTKVVIGDANPHAKLHVHNGRFLISDDSTGSSSGFSIRLDSYGRVNSDAHIYNQDGGDIKFYSSPLKLLHLRGNGEVGIGGIRPVNSLNLHKSSGNNVIQFTQGPNVDLVNPNGNTGFRIGIGFSGDGIINMNEDKSIYFLANNTQRLAILNTANGGQVRVGTPSAPVMLRTYGGIHDNTLTGTGNRNVMVNAQGKLIEEVPPVKTGIVSVNRFECVNKTNKTVYRNIVGRLATGEVGSLSAPVDLPHGATVTKVVFHFMDRHNTLNMRMYLVRGFYNSVGIGSTLMADVTTSGNSGSPQLTSITDNTISSSGIDNENNYYYLYFFTENNDPWPSHTSPSLGFLYASIHYALP